MLVAFPFSLTVPLVMKLILSRGVLLLVVLALAVTGAARAEEDEAGFKPIFNGQNLDGWDGNPKFWSVQDGAITGQTTPANPTQGNTFLIWRQGELDDFELRLEYKIVDGNSGIQYRSRDLGNWVVGGYQADIDSGETYSGINYEEQGRGILAGRGDKVEISANGEKKTVAKLGDSKELQANIKKEDWNQYRLIARGNHLVHMINGKVFSETVDHQDPNKEARVPPHALAGILALQLHAGPPMTVQFRKVRLKRLALADGRKKVVLVAGAPSHAAGDHEFNAGATILKNCLDRYVPQVRAALYVSGNARSDEAAKRLRMQPDRWPTDPTAFDNADSVFLYMDGGGGHPAIQPERLKELGGLMDRGVGLACAHYAVEVPKDRGGPEFINWIGGYYETDFSINPHWDADFKQIPEHAVTRGVKPFKINDEWYYNMRFREGAVTPLLSATPPDETRRTAAAAAAKGRIEVVAWALERKDGGRGFGFTGGHKHANWGQADFRKLVLNALLWTAKVDVPAAGVVSEVSEEELVANLDPKGK